MLPSYLRRKYVFDKFLNKYVHLSSKSYADFNSLLSNDITADAYCTGSDQIWNSLWNEGVDKSYFLEWVPENAFCFSYASSIGNSVIAKEESQELSVLLKKYKYLSVREDSAVKLLNQMGFDDVEHVLDPTLLMTEEDWTPYVSDRYKNKKFVVTYNLHQDKRVDEIASQIAKKRHCEVYNITYNWHDCIRKGKTLWCPGVDEYLGLIRDAEYVVADSFHATVFSLIFHTPFFSVVPEKANSRLISLLKSVGLSHRLCNTNPTEQEIDAPIDFVQVDTAIETMRGVSNAYIHNVISEIKKHK